MKNLKIILNNLAIISLTLFAITIWSDAMAWVQSIHWGWFLGIGVILLILPMFKKVKK